MPRDSKGQVYLIAVAVIACTILAWVINFPESLLVLAQWVSHL